MLQRCILQRLLVQSIDFKAFFKDKKLKAPQEEPLYLWYQIPLQYISDRVLPIRHHVVYGSFQPFVEYALALGL